jgi:hypothetical protein
LPQQPKFYELFESASANLLDIARALQDLMDNYTDVEQKAARITALEEKGDTIVHQVIELAHSSLIAPLDNEDSQTLIGSLDDAVDGVEATAVRMAIFRIEQTTPIARQLAALVAQGAQEVHAAIPGLRSRKQLEKMRSHIIEINRIESEGDACLRQGLEELVANHADVFNLIRWKEIYEYLEATTDRIEDISDFLQRLLIKNA